ncbi:hypothetical protein A5893_05020 [Pedobacter psychrophilus]|uniref:SusC/RagA family TonB-linked outer membrane protein n=1 Tax=Pedobacter psychrophilus TaxID=1826909 RepID=A0A179DGV8_9SPHI|nr:TonB-dependent receptor [Pedobacter psychrophilus]OAQ40316.1 hypothetical protein A5893_05020 [Pedobacter psychrophilus]
MRGFYKGIFGFFNQKINLFRKKTIDSIAYSLLVFAILCFLPNHLIAQTKLLTGKISDERSLPVIGATVKVKGTSNGTGTDANGMFKINVLPTDTIQVIYLGYKTVERVVGSASVMNINLDLETENLYEVVVVGYGVQKKVNVTGAVAAIDGKAIQDRPVTNVSSALAGLASGVSVQQGSGRPGSDGATIRIRGTGTLNNNDAVVIIDGIQGSIDAVNPNDIESISILKDAASASIYGSIAANGVILITTKKGSANKMALNYTGILSQMQPAAIPSMVSDYATHMNLVNEGFRNLGQPNAYTQATIDAWENAKLNPNGTNSIGVPNYIAYPNTDWPDVIFNNSVLQNHNLSMIGGSEKINFLLSGGYLQNEGVMENTENIRYQFRGNLQAKATKFLSVGTQTFLSRESSGLGGSSTFDVLYAAVPGQYPYLDGRYGFAQAPEEALTNNPLGSLRNLGGNDNTTRFNSTLFANLDIIKGLKFETRVNYQEALGEKNIYAIPQERWDFGANQIRVPASLPENLNTSYSMNKNYTVIFDNVLRYSTVLATKHDIGLLAGYNQNYFHGYNFNATGRGLIDAGITTLGSATSALAVGGGENDRAIRSWFGRLNYAFDQRYLFEAVVRYDGSSRFAPETRWGFFPAVSAGWRISQENFMKNVDFVSNLKLRASYGQTGNNASGNYDYQSTYNTQNYSFNNTPLAGLAQDKIANRNLKWETTTLTNLGLDGNLFKGAINFEIDAYNRLTDGILFVPTIPLTVGTAAAPTRNIAAVINRGLELQLGYQNNSRKLNWSVSGNFAYNYNNIQKYKGQLNEGYSDAGIYSTNLGEVSSGGNQRIVEGHKINEFYLYPVYKGSGNYKNADGSVNINGGPTDGMIRTPADLDWLNAMLAAGYKFLPSNTVGKTNIYYGDFIYADSNGDGSYGNTFDRKFTGASAAPKYNFGFQGNLKWNNFDLFMLWSGSAGMKYYWNERAFNNSIVELADGVGSLVAGNHYYYNETNPSDPANNINGKYPRLKNTTDSQNNIPSDFYFYDASYIKLKNMQLGYNIPDAFLKKIKMSRARIFVSGENLLTITDYPGLDPEIGASVNYPTARQYSLGLNVSF